MENITLVTWDKAFLLDERLASEWENLVDMINIHEMAHSYFGDATVCRHFEHSWLKESWATYIESIYLLDHHGTHNYILLIHSKAVHYVRKYLWARSIFLRDALCLRACVWLSLHVL